MCTYISHLRFPVVAIVLNMMPYIRDYANAATVLVQVEVGQKIPKPKLFHFMYIYVYIYKRHIHVLVYKHNIVCIGSIL